MRRLALIALVAAALAGCGGDGDGTVHAATLDGTLMVSSDGGRTFTEQIAGG